MKCTSCDSENIIKFGDAYIKKAVVQRYKCNDCGKLLYGELDD